MVQVLLHGPCVAKTTNTLRCKRVSVQRGNPWHTNRLSELVVCPDATASQEKCLNDTSWTSNLGWTTSLDVSYPQADVAYSQINGTILWHALQGAPPLQATINSSELLQVYDVVFNASASNAITPIDIALKFLGMGSNKPTIPFFVWWYFYRLRQLQLQNAGASTRAVVSLHSLLAIPIYYCQVKGFAELRSSGYNAINSFAATVMSQLPFAEPDTTLVPATIRYALDVDSSTIIPYIALGGLTLLLCFLALTLTTLVSLGKSISSSPYPTLDFYMKYNVYDGEHGELDFERFRDMDGRSDAAVRRLVSHLKIKVAQG